MTRLKTMEVGVSYILQDIPETRDNDKKLYFAFLYRHGVDPFKVTLAEYLFSTDNSPQYESVCRCRRKLQEHNKDLRGKVWYERHREEEEYEEYSRTDGICDSQ